MSEAHETPTSPDPSPTPPRTHGQRKIDILISRIYEELSIEYPDLKSKPEIRLVNKDHPYELWTATFTERDPVTQDRLLKAMMWNGSSFDTYDYLNQAMREYTAILKERRNNALAQFLTSPLTIGAFIGILLVIITAIQLFIGKEDSYKLVPDQLWSILTAVIAFYFGRGSVDQNNRKRSTSDEG
jgi:hypothetical protein